MRRRTFLGGIFCGITAASLARADDKPRRIVLRSSWQTVNIGDIAHTPGMLALLEEHHPDAVVTLWPNALSSEVEQLLLARFPKLVIAKSNEEQLAALNECDFFLHGSGPGLVGHAATELARKAGKPYGFAGVTLNDEELKTHRELLSGAQFVFTRDSDSLAALRQTGIRGPEMAFGPDATFAIDLRDDAAAAKLLKEHDLQPGKFLCAVPRLRWTPYWEIHPERVKPNPERSAINEAFAERDHAKQREAIIAWVRETGQRVFIVPEMTYAVQRMRPLLYDPLPEEIKPSVAVIDRYWLTPEAASVYAQAAAVLSFELHSPIMAIAAGTPAVYLRQPTDTRKGQMWRDVGLGDWIFEIDASTGEQIAARVVEIGRNRSAARAKASEAKEFTRQRMAEMVARIG